MANANGKNLFIIILGLTMFCSVSWASSTRIDSLLLVLDEVIANRPIYLKKKQMTINALRYRLGEDLTMNQRFKVLGDLEKEYHYFNTDSAMLINKRRLILGKELNKKEFIDEAYIDMANVLTVAGMYKEALDTLMNICLEDLSYGLRGNYWHVNRKLYQTMAEYAITDEARKSYFSLKDDYLNLLLTENVDDQWMFVDYRANKLNNVGEYDKAIDLLMQYLNSGVMDEHIKARVRFMLSESYRLKGEIEKQKELLILSAISDMKAVVREYVSLRKVAVFLFDEGEIDKSYSYVKICLEDATACNAHIRKLEILEVFPVINAAYQLKEQEQNAYLRMALLCISLLFVFLILSLFYIYKMMIRLKDSHSEIYAANEDLRILNEELFKVNGELREANHNLAESSYLKEAYIGRYMDWCSVYLEKMNEYRCSLSKIAITGNIEELYKRIKSTKFIDEELKDFYANFDNTFLQLFPSFVEDFNALLIENKRIYPKQGERMNTELRIYALIRLGITDSVKIAQFLRYSVTTIYNYRVKVRNRALVNRDSLENEVMKIGKISTDSIEAMLGKD